ncbi:hypothetical protein RCH12_001935 [Cryobacterium sp. MP_3.1]|uniref:hypothetical protein n=1 Tax=Cryobacterium sp. MP_3.1 TaxID=3071711 RepID=UPI002E0C2A45|nr:hypothetical protein [Cryobacterium sp. MP_3.1]
MSKPVADHPRAHAAENRIAFDGLVAQAAHAIHKNRFRSAAVSLQSAARFAWYNHPGMFRSVKLEDLAARIGERLPPAQGMRVDLSGHVVHVLSQAYAAGGHTRLVWRWIENDASHINSVVLTGQQGIPVPHQLADAVAASGGQIVSLGVTSSSLLVRAAELRRIAESGVHTMVLHVHPYDVVPSIALANVPARIVFLNHADHVFWAGGSIADAVADIRPAGQQLTIAERNLPGSISTILPIPLTAPPQTDRRLARDRLGIAQDAVVIISIASGYKYGALPGDHFIDIHREFVLVHPEAILLVIGPEPEGRWQAVSEETNGRFRAVGMVQGLDDYYGAADLYVDSIPFASLTSLLDAAARGVPVLALSETVADSVLTSNDLSLTDHGVHYTDRAQYIQALAALTTQPHERRQQGQVIQRAVVEDHLSPGWNRYLDRLLETSATSPDEAAATPARSGPPATGLSELEEALVDFQSASGLAEPLWASRLRDAPYMPGLDRARLLISVPTGHRRDALKFMVPDALRSKVKIRLASLAHRSRRRP